MTRSKITKRHSIVLLLLSLLSLITLFALPFVPSIFISEYFECGMGYIGWAAEKLFDFDLISEIFNGGFFIFGDIDGWILAGISAAALLCALISLLAILFSLSKMKKDVFPYRVRGIIWSHFGWSLAYFGFCGYILLRIFDWDIEFILEKDVLSWTYSYIPLAVHTVLLIAMLIVRGHWKKKVGSLPFFSHFSDDEHVEGSSDVVLSDAEIAKTLEQYKELLDSGIITSEEYDKKKDQLLQENEDRKREKLGKHGAATGELSHVCRECGYPLGSSRQVCPHCGARVGSEDDTAK